jgi:hypothetical protein
MSWSVSIFLQQHDQQAFSLRESWMRLLVHQIHSDGSTLITASGDRRFADF